MNDVPGVCIMIPTYNQANYIAKAVESALAQDYANIEIVIADDNSTDNTAEVLELFSKNQRIKYRKNSANLGRVGNYKKCLNEYTKAEWVINLDGDDYFTNDQYISLAMEAIQKSGIRDTLFYQGVNILKSDQFEKLMEPNIKSPEASITAEDYFFKFFERNYFSHMSTLYNRQAAIESDFYACDILSADIFSFLGLCLKFAEKKIIVSKSISGVWLQHENNISKTKKMKLHHDNFSLYKKLYHLSKEKDFSKWKCFKWLIKAQYTYLRSYIFNLIKL